VKANRDVWEGWELRRVMQAVCFIVRSITDPKMDAASDGRMGYFIGTDQGGARRVIAVELVSVAEFMGQPLYRTKRSFAAVVREIVEKWQA
jgi:hypothetical protein